MLYKFLTVLLIFSASIVFAIDQNNLGEKRKRPDSMMVNGQPPGKKNQYALHKACKKGNLEKVIKLLRTEDINEEIGSSGVTPILEACLFAQADIVIFLLSEEHIKKININASEQEGNSLLHLVCAKIKDKKAQEIIKKITEHQHFCRNFCNNEHKVPLHLACANNNLSAVEELLKDPKTDVNFSDKEDRTPLHVACLTENSEEVVEQLLKHPKINANMRYQHIRSDKAKSPKDLFTPLHTVCENGNKKLVQLLLKSDKIKINETTFLGHTPLDIAIINNKIEIVKLLLQEKGIDLYTNDGLTEDKYLYYTMYDEENNPTKIELVFKAFIDYQWDNMKVRDKIMITKFFINHKKTEIFNSILKKCEKNKVKNLSNEFSINKGDLLIGLHHNNCMNKKEVILFMEELNIDVNIKSIYYAGKTLLHAFCTDTEALDLLIKKNAEIDQKSDNGWTPLHYAANSLNLEAVKILINNKASINCTNNENLTPLDMVFKEYIRNPYNISKKATENLTEYLLYKGAACSEKYNEHNLIKPLLKQIRLKLENAKIAGN